MLLKEDVLELWNTLDGKLVRTVKSRGEHWNMHFAKDGSAVMMVNLEVKKDDVSGAEIELMDVKSGKVLATKKLTSGPKEKIFGPNFAVTSGGDLVAFQVEISEFGAVAIWRPLSVSVWKARRRNSVARNEQMAKNSRKQLGRYIVADPKICHGKPTFIGTRIMVWQVIEQVSEGMAWDEIVADLRGSVTKDAIAEAIESPQVANIRGLCDRVRSCAGARLNILDENVTGNMELHLDRRLVDKRVWPAIDINRSGTRKEEMLLHPGETEKVRILRRVLSDMHPVEAMEMLVSRLRKGKTNAEFLMGMNMS